MSGKPLHVQVADALGWRDCQKKPLAWEGIPPGKHGWYKVKRFDTDWSATGPLIERYLLRLDCAPEVGGELEWSASAGESSEFVGFGETALIAVCNLILALKAANRLE